MLSARAAFASCFAEGYVLISLSLYLTYAGVVYEIGSVSANSTFWVDMASAHQPEEDWKEPSTALNKSSLVPLDYSERCVAALHWRSELGIFLPWLGSRARW